MIDKNYANMTIVMAAFFVVLFQIVTINNITVTM